MMDNHLPCPFCLQVPKLVTENDFPYLVCMTELCPIQEQRFSRSAWNTRKKSAAMSHSKELIEQLAKEHLKNTRAREFAIEYVPEELEAFAKAYQSASDAKAVEESEQQPKQAIPEGYALININELNKIVGEMQGNDCFSEEVLSAVLDYIDMKTAPTNTEVGE